MALKKITETEKERQAREEEERVRAEFGEQFGRIRPEKKKPAPAKEQVPVPEEEDPIKFKLPGGPAPVETPVFPQRAITVGTETEEPQEIIFTPEIKKLEKEDPKLFKILTAEGIEVFNRAVSAEQFVSRQDAKKFRKLNTLLPDQQWIANSDLAQLKIDNPEAHKALISSGFDASNKVIDRQNEEAGLKNVAFRANQTAIARLSHVTDKAGFVDGAKYLRVNPGDTKTLRNAGFDEKTIALWKKQAQEEKTFAKLSTPQKILHTLTPWNEEAGETFAAFLMNPRKASQEQLKAEFEEFENRPLWQKFILNKYVIKAPDGTFLRIRLGMPPPIGPPLKLAAPMRITRAGKLVTAGPKDVGMTEAQFQRFLSSRVTNPKLTPESFKVVESTAQDVAKKMAKVDWKKITDALERGNIKGLTASEIRQIEAAMAVEAMIALGAFEQISLKNKVDVPDVSLEQFLQGHQNAGKASIESQLKKLRASQAPVTPSASQQKAAEKVLSSLKPKAAVTPREVRKFTFVLANAPDEALRHIRQLSPEREEELLDALSPAIRTAIKTGQKLETQRLAQEETLTKTLQATKLSLATQQAQKTATKTLLERKLKQKPAFKPAKTPALKTRGLLQPQTPGRLRTPIEPIEPTTLKPPQKKPPPKQLRRQLSGKEDKQRRKEIKEAPSAIAWPMGRLKGKMVWHILKEPFASDDDVITLVGKAPQGARIVKGPGSAKKGVQFIRGSRISKSTSVDVGIFDAKINPAGRRAVTLGFTPDPKQETISDLTISERRQRISGSGRKRITPKRPRIGR